MWTPGISPEQTPNAGIGLRGRLCFTFRGAARQLPAPTSRERGSRVVTSWPVRDSLWVEVGSPVCAICILLIDHIGRLCLCGRFGFTNTRQPRWPRAVAQLGSWNIGVTQTHNPGHRPSSPQYRTGAWGSRHTWSAEGPKLQGNDGDPQNAAATLPWPSAPGPAQPGHSRPAEVSWRSQRRASVTPLAGGTREPRAHPTRPGPFVGPGSSWTHGAPKLRAGTRCGTQ